MANDPERLLTTSEAAKILGLSRGVLASYVRRGLLRPYLTLPTGHYRWSLDDIRRQLAAIRPSDENDPDEP
jgi:DNA-binding transcriptional MerR regulator